MVRLLQFLLCLVLLCASGVARAGDNPYEEAAESNTDKARALFKAARALSAEGKHEQACAKFEESLALDDGMGTRFNLADCYEKLGRAASAQAMFLKVAEGAKAADQPEREKVARQRAAALEGKLAKLQLDVAERAPGLEIQRDGQKVDKDSWGSPLALDPGTYRLEASAPKKKVWSFQAKVTPGAVIVIVVPKLDDLAAAPAPVAQEPEPEPEPEPELEAAAEPAPAEPRDLAGRKMMRTASYVVGGVGIAALLAGATFALQYDTSNNDAQAVCRQSVDCTPQEISLHESLVEDSKRSATLAYVGFGVGSVAMIGAVLLYTASAGDAGETLERPAAGRVRATPHVAADGSWGASLIGSF